MPPQASAWALAIRQRSGAGPRPAAGWPRGPSTRTAHGAGARRTGRQRSGQGAQPAEQRQVVRPRQHVDRVDLQQPGPVHPAQRPPVAPLAAGRRTPARPARRGAPARPTGARARSQRMCRIAPEAVCADEPDRSHGRGGIDEERHAVAILDRRDRLLLAAPGERPDDREARRDTRDLGGQPARRRPGSTEQRPQTVDEDPARPVLGQRRAAVAAPAGGRWAGRSPACGPGTARPRTASTHHPATTNRAARPAPAPAASHRDDGQGRRGAAAEITVALRKSTKRRG